jgi:hypothetical protein
VVRGKADDAQFDSTDGHLHLHLQATPRGLFVEWIRTGANDVTLIQCLLLDSLDALHQWIEAEAFRHKDPGLHQRLCRQGEELLDGKGH